MSDDGLNWSVMTKTSEGVVSVVRGLTEDEARNVYVRLDPFYGRISYPGEHNTFTTSGPYIEIREVFGPPGWKMDASWYPWPRDATPEEIARRVVYRENEARWRAAELAAPKPADRKRSSWW